MKIITPKRKVFYNVPVTQYSFKIGTVNQLWLKLIEELEEQVPDSLKFGLGYCDGKHQAKIENVNQSLQVAC